MALEDIGCIRPLAAIAVEVVPPRGGAPGLQGLRSEDDPREELSQGRERPLRKLRRR